MTGEKRGKVVIITLEELAVADPDSIIFVPCGYDLERSAQELLKTTLLQSEGTIPVLISTAR